MLKYWNRKVLDEFEEQFEKVEEKRGLQVTPGNYVEMSLAEPGT